MRLVSSPTEVFGAVAHGLALTDAARSALWHPLHLALGLAVALFFVGGVYDLRGTAAAVQASDVAIHVIVPFDQNGVFHMVQLLAIVALAYGLRVGLMNGPP